MGFLLKRAFVTPVLLTVGLLAMLGGDINGGGLIDLVAMAYWVIVGWSHRWRSAGARSSSRTPDVVMVVDQGGRSDGVDGAFARLHPDMRTWLEEELRARRDPGPR